MPGAAAFAIPAALSIGGGILKGIASNNAAQTQAGILNNNEKIASQAAGDALVRGQQAATAREMQGSATEGKQQTAFAANGVVSNAGSALDVLSDTSMMSELDARTLQNNAAREAWGYKAQATQFSNQAALAQQSGASGELGDILGGVTAAAGSQGFMKLVGG